MSTEAEQTTKRDYADCPLVERLNLACVAACDCIVKTPVTRYHKPLCRYRVMKEAADEIERLQRERDEWENLAHGWKRNADEFCCHSATTCPHGARFCGETRGRSVSKAQKAMVVCAVLAPVFGIAAGVCADLGRGHTAFALLMLAGLSAVALCLLAEQA